MRYKEIEQREATKSHPEIPCEVCGYPRTFAANLQWCSNCGWNSQAAFLGLRARSRMMAAVAACIVMGEILLLVKIPSMGFVYLPLVCFLAGAIAFIPYREYRSVQRARMLQPHRPSPEVIVSNLQRLQPELRTLALIPLGVAAATIVLLLMTPSSWGDRIVPIAIIFGVLLFFAQFLKERRILASYAPTLGRVIAFERGEQRGRKAIYEYESPVGVVRGQGGALAGFEVGMTVPILYNVFKPDESIPVPDFLFYRIRAELL